MLVAVATVKVLALLLALPLVVIWVLFAIRTYDEDDSNGVLVVASYCALATVLSSLAAFRVAEGDHWFLIGQLAILVVGYLIWRRRRAIESRLSDRTRSILRWVKEPWGI